MMYGRGCIKRLEISFLYSWALLMVDVASVESVPVALGVIGVQVYWMCLRVDLAAVTHRPSYFSHNPES